MSLRPRVLVVGGRDPSGAGLDADRDGLAGLELDAAYVATADTDQDDRAVRAIGARDPRRWGAEALACAERGCEALKFGLLPGAAHVERAARLVRELARGAGPRVVVDPVIAASSGVRFLAAGDVEALRGELLGLSVIVTPNVPEAAELARVPVDDLAHDPGSRIEAARILLGLGAAAVILKGGHGSEEPVLDLLLELGGQPVWLPHPRTRGGRLRGSGCRFAARVAGRLALGEPLEAATRDAGQHVAARIAAAGR
ncbi:MAG: bifunctional hydroxymethylpyrimidine kinase/phosphomethylpyrimidine kinase [Planctomycetes bacterium]|nr:bifunctional hydroxymethylpyrimidine kinase/phosphomethylpyrimidine kinase [Planctomycetota bacterium]